MPSTRKRFRRSEIYFLIYAIPILLIILIVIFRRGASPPPSSSTPAVLATNTLGPDQVEVRLASSITKQDWIDAVTEAFNTAQFKTTSGKTIVVRVTHGTSGGQQQDILNAKIQPTAWSPGDQSWVDEANLVWKDRTGQPLVSTACPPTVYAPIGFGMWRPMAEILGWPDKSVSWDDIISLASDPRGWARYEHPEWGQFTFGHPHPAYSNFGLLMTAEIAYSTLDLTGDLTPEMVRDQRVVDAMSQLEMHTYHYGIQSRNLLDLMAQRGPSYLHAVMTAEAEILKANHDHASELRYPLAFIFPAEGTFWTEQPYCILNGADWVDNEQGEAAAIFRDYLLRPAQQSLAIDNYLRPVDSSIALHVPISLENGSDPDITLEDVPPLASPSGEVAAALKDIFLQTKKKATIVILLDISLSMEGDKMKGAVEATANFIGRLERDDYILVMPFFGEVTELRPFGLRRDVAEDLEKSVRALRTQSGTALYDGVCQAVERVKEIRADNDAKGNARLYGIVVLSDGVDNSSIKTQADMMSTCLPSGENVGDIKVFTIAYGDDANKALLQQIASHTNGRTFAGNPATIEQVYLAISAEQ